MAFHSQNVLSPSASIRYRLLAERLNENKKQTVGYQTSATQIFFDPECIVLRKRKKKKKNNM